MRNFLSEAKASLIVLVVILVIVGGAFFIFPISESSCDSIYCGYAQEVPAVPENTVEETIEELTVVNRYAYSSSRSSSVDYRLTLRDADGNSTYVSVSKKNFINVPDGTTYYYYRYVVRPLSTYGERVARVISNTWLLFAILGTIPFIVALMNVISCAIDEIRDSRYIVTDNDEDYWGHY